MSTGTNYPRSLKFTSSHSDDESDVIDNSKSWIAKISNWLWRVSGSSTIFSVSFIRTKHSQTNQLNSELKPELTIYKTRSWCDGFSSNFKYIQRLFLSNG